MAEPDITHNLHALLVEVTAGEGCDYEAGHQRRLQVVVEAESSAEAQNEAMVALARNSWIGGQVLRQAPVTNDMASEPGYLQDAIWNARANGAAIVIYDDPQTS